MISRRHLLALGSSALLLPSFPALADEDGERKFLFVFCFGGWDVTRVYAPLFESPVVSMESDAAASTIGGLTFVDSEARPSVRSFFESHAEKACVINGFEVTSITHQRCLQILQTGSGAGSRDDWGSRIGHGSSLDPTMPYVVVGGPAYTSELANDVVRLGNDGQFERLLSGSSLELASRPAEPLSEATAAEVDAFLRGDIERFVEAGVGQDGARFGGLYTNALDRQATLASQGGVDFNPEKTSPPVRAQLNTALDALELGLSRCAQVEYQGTFEQTWDTHSDNSRQSDHFEELFEVLSDLMDDLALRPSPGGSGTLADETTVVVWSEMARTPALNTSNGKDHWTFTSCMLVGDGITGGRVVGGFDDTQLGQPIDLSTGELSDAGTTLGAANIGATLLALADVDPGEDEPIVGILA
ncbi:MAG: DUF1501 domain-containing protein [Proteobacteria bacterium]|nr:DUF1501 domain-containing protein [Pseudomonadota bacterium]MCP4921505.1 DUF1501 domain-containing protein [Pseudomonadota bacterium]